MMVLSRERNVKTSYLELFAPSRNSISRSGISTEAVFVSSESYFREFLGSVPGKLA